MGRNGGHPLCYHQTQNQVGRPEGEDLNLLGRFVHTSLDWIQSPAIANESCPPGGSVVCDPASCALLRDMGLATEAVILLLMGAVLLFLRPDMKLFPAITSDLSFPELAQKMVWQ